MSGNNFDEDLLTLIKNGEGSIEYMYLDTVGRVTVGVGNMLPNAAAAQALSFLQRSNNSPATPQQIASEFEFISQQQSGKVASGYKAYTKLYLSGAAIDTLLEKRIVEFATGLKQNFPAYDQYPDPAKLALMDMAFNLGVAGLVTKFPSLTRAARSKDWDECANQCNRVGIGDNRNAETKALFLAAKKAEAEV